MSLCNRNRFGNISKVKYYLPGQRVNRQTKQIKSFIQSRAPTRKQSTSEDNRLDEPITLNSFSKNDISFEILGVSDINNQPAKQTKQQHKEKSKDNETRNIFGMFPQGKEKEQFLKFVEGLKHDQNYQNTITMFTIMYYYQKKTGQKMNQFL